MRFCIATSFALMFLVAMVSGQAQSTSAAQPQRPVSQTQGDARGNATAGKALYTAHQCWACHGSNGETDVRFIQENGAFIRRLQTVEEFVRFIRAPRPGEAPPAASSKSMPSYGVASLSDREAADLWAYIRTFKPTQPPLKDIPLLNQMLNEGGKLKR